MKSSIKLLTASKFIFALMLALLPVSATHGQKLDAQSAPVNWARWRGPTGNGISTNQQPVTSWSETENVIWRTKVPGKGHASPIVTDSKIFLTTADEQAQTQSVVAFERETGKQVWNTVVNTGGFPKEVATNQLGTSSFASFALADNKIYTRVGDKRDGYQEWLYCIGER